MMVHGPQYTATRAAGLDRLANFTPLAGSDYAEGRNSDLGPSGPSAVSRMSPYLRYRLVEEQEVVTTILAHHGYAAAEKYLQEVLWRTYWKGWLEMRPSVWTRFVSERGAQRSRWRDTAALADAESGNTGIAGFDDWARELVSTGSLHNHARMWFASIWIFTLKLPWALGADFFLRHLIDADPASNTLSWRWVAGLQTPGKTYLATSSNIERYTGGRFAPTGLANSAVALTEPPVAAAMPIREAEAGASTTPALLLVTHEDMRPESLLHPSGSIAAALIIQDANLLWGDNARAFVVDASADTAERVARHFRCRVNEAASLDAAQLIGAAQSAGVRHIVTPFAHVGPVADTLVQFQPLLASEGISLSQHRRSWDAKFWPFAKKGFFPFKEQIPRIIEDLGLF